MEVQDDSLTSSSLPWAPKAIPQFSARTPHRPFVNRALQGSERHNHQCESGRKYLVLCRVLNSVLLRAPTILYVFTLSLREKLGGREANGQTVFTNCSSCVSFSLFFCHLKKRIKKMFGSSLLMFWCFLTRFVTGGLRCCSTFIKHECKLLCNMAVTLYIV